MSSLDKWKNKAQYLTLTPSGQSLEQRPLSTVEEEMARVRHDTQHVLQVQHNNTAL